MLYLPFMPPEETNLATEHGYAPGADISPHATPGPFPAGLLGAQQRGWSKLGALPLRAVVLK